MDPELARLCEEAYQRGLRADPKDVEAKYGPAIPVSPDTAHRFMLEREQEARNPTPVVEHLNSPLWDMRITERWQNQFDTLDQRRQWVNTEQVRSQSSPPIMKRPQIGSQPDDKWWPSNTIQGSHAQSLREKREMQYQRGPTGQRQLRNASNQQGSWPPPTIPTIRNAHSQARSMSLGKHEMSGQVDKKVLYWPTGPRWKDN